MRTTNEANARREASENARDVFFGAVVHEDDLVIAERLRKDGLDRLARKRGAIVKWNDDGNSWHSTIITGKTASRERI